MPINTAAQQAAQILGGQSALAKVCGVTPQAVSQWINGARSVPSRRCVLIERATGGAVSRRDLRPTDWNDFWPEMAKDSEVSHA